MSIADVIYANQIRITPCSDKQEDHAKPVERRVSGSHATHEQPRHAARAASCCLACARESGTRPRRTCLRKIQPKKLVARGMPFLSGNTCPAPPAGPGVVYEFVSPPDL